MGQLPCLSCKHAEINSSEINPDVKFIRCPYKNDGRWRFYRVNKDYSDFKCEHHEKKE
ncbi:MAG: hypothetical protein NDF55_00750 [archaeon GB-1867-005]|nr:hypothetical protein [Candidatus Culexmicrobium cathedralense]